MFSIGAGSGLSGCDVLFEENLIRNADRDDPALKTAETTKAKPDRTHVPFNWNKAGLFEMGRKILVRARNFPFDAVIVCLAVVSCLATYLIFNNLTWITPTHDVVVSALLINLILLIALAAVVAYQLFALWRARRRQAAGAGLHVRILSLFALLAVIPAIILATFATVSLDRVLDGMFTARVKSIVANSVDVANSYMKDHGQVIRAEIVSMAEELEKSVQLTKENPKAFETVFIAKATSLNLPVAYLLDGQGNTLAVHGDTKAFAQGMPPKFVFDNARAGRVVILGPEFTGGVGALKKLSTFEDTYLYIIRPVRQDVIRFLQKTQANVADYARLEAQLSRVQLVFAVMYALITFTLLLTAIWFGLRFTTWLVAPIRRLIDAAQQVSQGNLNVVVEAKPKQGDVGQLGETFNQMTRDLAKQRSQLMNANAELEERRRFIEAVLSGVSAGVLGLDASGKITLANKSAVELLGVREDQLIGQHLSNAVPEFGAILQKSQKNSRKPVQQQVTIIREGGERNYSVRVTREGEERKDYGIVLTFDDVSELVVAQRTSAWADVARRIAHEIKNPLTPIQLSAERIRRKYGDAITTDREIFDRCTNTIIKHVGDIGRMVDEFSSFARMPQAVMEETNICEIVREAVILFQMSNSDIKYTLDLPDTPLLAQADRRLLTQAVTNLVKNAGEAIASAQASPEAEPGYQGRITVRLRQAGPKLAIEVIDNGCGLPKENRHRLVEPYVTTRAKGTGLGLAIVQRITEQHGGVLELEDAVQDDGTMKGALVRITIPAAKPLEAAAKPGQPAADAQKSDAPRPKPKGRTKTSSGKRSGKRTKEGVTYGV